MTNSDREWVIFGSTGLLGSEFRGVLESSGEKFMALTRNEVSIRDNPDALARLIPEGSNVLNCIAYTAVDKAEVEPQVAHLVNSEFVERLGRAVLKTNSKMIHFSTDYVFGGQERSPRIPQDTPSPINSYGRTKLEGEVRLLALGAAAVVVRTSWLYGAHGNCFPISVAKKLMAGEGIRVVNDQIGSPTWANDLVQWILRASLADLQGPHIEHVSASGQASWFEFSLEIARLLGVRGEMVTAISSSQANQIASRPPYSVLESGHLFGHNLRNWQQMLEEAWPHLRLSLNQPS